jgi:hypothetical protein
MERSVEITVMAYLNVLSHYLSVGITEITKHLIMLTTTLSNWWSQLSNLNLSILKDMCIIAKHMQRQLSGKYMKYAINSNV